MSFLDTTVAPIERPQRGARAASWGAFRITDPRERLALLREVCRNDVPLTLGTPGGRSVPALLWSVDDGASRLNLSLGDAGALELPSPLWAAGYLRQAKLQFELRNASLRRRAAGATRMLQAELPQYMVRLSRRRHLRVRRPDEQMPLLRLVHPLLPALRLTLPLLDLSAGGCALWQHPGGLALAAGAQLPQAELLLDTQVLRVSLVVHRMGTEGAEPRPGARLGCEWGRLGRDAGEALQRWVARGQRRRDLVSLTLD